MAGALGLVVHRNPVYCALFLILALFCISGLFLLLQAEFIAVIQIIVYAGAIMVLFLFVIMLLNMGNEASFREKFSVAKGAALLLGVLLLVLLGKAIWPSAQTGVVSPFSYGKVEMIGHLLFTEYVFPFEAISVILLAALIGAVIIARKS